MSYTNLGPLTTAFTPPSHCAADLYYAFALQSTLTATAFRGFDCSNATDGRLTVDKPCYPGSTVASFLVGGGYYSPGLVCPLGYTTACSSTVGLRGPKDFFFEVPEQASADTVIGCCPVGGFSCGLSTWPPGKVGRPTEQACVRTFWSSESVSTPVSNLMRCDHGTRVPWDAAGGYYSFTSISTTTRSDRAVTTTFKHDRLEVYASLFQLHHQPSDLNNPSATVSDAAKETGSQAPETQASKPGLSEATATGIGVVVGIVVLCVIGVTVWLFLRKRRSAKVKETTGASAPPYPELAVGLQRFNQLPVAELDSTAPTSEMMTERHPQELASVSPTTELPGGGQAAGLGCR